jgi:hypothetical protein
MSTATPEQAIDEHPDIQGLNGQAQATPKRGRPKGSRNKPRAVSASAPVVSQPPEARVVLIEDGRVTVVTDKGEQAFVVESKFVLDRRK